jgi:hypothetical protein
MIGSPAPVVERDGTANFDDMSIYRTTRWSHARISKIDWFAIGGDNEQLQWRLKRV